MKALLPRLFLSLFLAIDAAALGALLLNWLYPVVDQGLAGGAIVLFRGVAVGIGAAVLMFLLYPLLPANLARWLLYLLGLPALVLSLLLAVAIRQNQREQSAYIDELVARMPPFQVYLANSERQSPSAFVDIEFDSARGRYEVLYPNNHSCIGQLSQRAEQKLQLLKVLRALEGLFADQPAPCPLRDGQWLYSLNFEIHDYQPPHTQYSLLLDQACLDRHPAMAEAVAVIHQAHSDLRDSEDCQ